MKRHKQFGFTLIELLVVLAVIGVLVALTVPAVQRVRDAAARAECQNNLKQLGLAAHQYHDQNKSFPPGIRWRDGKDPRPYMTWLAHLLPYIEQDALWQRTVRAYQETSAYGGARPYFPATGPHAEGFATVIPLFSCPADGRVMDPHTLDIAQVPVALTNYVGVTGRDLYTRDGMFYRDSHVRIVDVRDGTSNTLLIGERPPNPDYAYSWWYAAAGVDNSGSPGVTLGVEELNVVTESRRPCPPGRYRFEPGDPNNPCDVFHYWSLHTGGANFLFCDGSVHFLSYDAAPLLPALASRAGREPVNPF